MVQIRLPELREELLNQLPAAHGGVLMSLLDSVMSRAASALPQAPSQTAVTVEMSSRFPPPRSRRLADRGLGSASQPQPVQLRRQDHRRTRHAGGYRPGHVQVLESPTTLEK